MQERPDRRRPRRRGRVAPQRPQRPQRAQPAPQAPAPQRALARRPRRDRRRTRGPDELRPGTPCVILLDCREGEPDRTGSRAVYEGTFDPESGEPRRPGNGVPRLRLEAGERVWGFEVWWREDPQRAGLTPTDHDAVEMSKRLLRGLLRDARRRVLVQR